MDDHCPVIWPRAILHVDMNAYFASVEQRDFPRLRGKPVAVTNGMRGSCIITCSYEARAAGVHTGMRLTDAGKLCPDLIQRPARPRVYAATSTAIMQAMQDVSPDIEVFSVDEAFLDVTRCQKLHGTPPRMASMVKQRIWEVSGLLCSAGVAGDKTTAKFAAKLQKPNGLTVIPPWSARQRLCYEPVTALCGIADGVGTFLAQHGAYTCGDVGKLPISVLARRFGNLGRRIWLMCQGDDPDKIHRDVPAPKSMGHGKILPPNSRRPEVLLTYLRHMSEKLAARLRRHNMQAQLYAIYLRTQDGKIARKLQLSEPGNDAGDIFKLCRFLLTNYWQGEGVFQVQVTALDPQPADLQLTLFGHQDPQQKTINKVMDNVNQRFGEFALTPARLLDRTDMPNVIAPAWKPQGHRQTIE